MILCGVALGCGASICVTIQSQIQVLSSRHDTTFGLLGPSHHVSMLWTQCPSCLAITPCPHDHDYSSNHHVMSIVVISGCCFMIQIQSGSSIIVTMPRLQAWTQVLHVTSLGVNFMFFMVPYLILTSCFSTLSPHPFNTTSLHVLPSDHVSVPRFCQQ